MGKLHDTGTPEQYLYIPADSDEGNAIDAISCILLRAEATTMLLGAAFDPGAESRLSDELLANACWSLSGLIKQATIILEGQFSQPQSEASPQVAKRE